MICNHCLVAFHESGFQAGIGRDKDGEWLVNCYKCPECKRFNLILICGENDIDLKTKKVTFKPIKVLDIWPRNTSRKPCPQQVPKAISEDYEEACLVLTDSTKASAALSRRCLQNLLRDAAKVKHDDLSKEIQQVIDSGKLPSDLSDAIDHIRNVGNFGTHPLKSQSTGQILPVESHEAEWNLEVLEELFDHYYVKPSKIAAKRKAMNEKLAEAGKPPMK